MKKFLYTLCSIALAFSFAACSSDDGDESGGGNGNEGNNGNSKDYIISSRIKTIKLSSYSNRTEYIIYEDYARRYAISFSESVMYLLPYERIYGSFSALSADKSTCSILTFHDITSLTDLDEDSKAEARQKCNNYYNGSQPYDRRNYAYADFAPGCGFVIWFMTETGEDVYIRMRSTGYTLDAESTLETVTFECQLF